MSDAQEDLSVDLSVLAAKAAEVAANAETYDTAINAERNAEALVLQAAIESVKPALKALASKIESSSYETMGQNGCNPVSRTTYFQERGFVLVDEYSRTRDTTGNRGDVGGYRILLLSDGRLARVRRRGTFSNWQGEADEWTAELTFINTRDLMDRERLDDCLKAISEALDAQLKGAIKSSTKAAIQRAEKLAALVVLAA